MEISSHIQDVKGTFNQTAPKGQSMNKNMLNVMVGTVAAIIVAELLQKKTPLGRMLGI